MDVNFKYTCHPQKQKTANLWKYFGSESGSH